MFYYDKPYIVDTYNNNKMTTDFSLENAEFTKKAHNAAKRWIYPYIFNTTPQYITYEETVLKDGDERSKILDCEMAVDYKVFVKVEDLHSSLSFTVQERFRKPKHQHYQDLTITEYNNSTKQLSELYKLSGGMFVYGYYDEPKDKIIQSIAISSSSLLTILTRSLNNTLMKTNLPTIKYKKEYNPRSHQDFITVRFNELRKNNLLLYDSHPPTKTSKEIIIETIQVNPSILNNIKNSRLSDTDINSLIYAVRRSNNVISDDSIEEIKELIKIIGQEYKTQYKKQ